MKAPRLFLLIALIATSSTPISAQSTVSGIISEQDSDRAIEGARVTVVGGITNDAVTDSEGTFVLKFAKDPQPGTTVRIHVEKQGYTTYDKLVSVSSAIPLRISLRPIANSRGARQPRNEATGPGPAKKAESLTIGITAEQAFAVAVETKLFVPGPYKDSAGTGFWTLNGVGRNCYLSSADAAIFFRIRNLQSTKTMITAYNVYAIGGELTRLKLNISRPYLIMSAGALEPHPQPSAP